MTTLSALEMILTDDLKDEVEAITADYRRGDSDR